MSSGDATHAPGTPPGESSPRLAEVQAAFREGNYAEVRALAARLEREEPALAPAAREWVERTRPEPLVLWLFGLSALVLLCATLFAYGTH